VVAARGVTRVSQSDVVYICLDVNGAHTGAPHFEEEDTEFEV